MNIQEILQASLSKLSSVNNSNSIYAKNLKTETDSEIIFEDTIDEDSKLEEKNESNNTEKNTNAQTYDESIQMESGEKTNYSLVIDGKVYYYPDMMTLGMAKIAEDPAATAVGIGNETNEWGNKTEYYKVIDGSVYYFSSEFDKRKTALMTVDAAKRLAVGAQKNDNQQNPEEIKSSADAVSMISGNKSEFYIDSENIRYYYSSYADMSKAAFSNDFSKTATGTAQVMEEWGIVTDYFIKHNNYTYYFNSEEDKQAAQQQLDERGGGIFAMPHFEKYTVGKRS